MKKKAGLLIFIVILVLLILSAVIYTWPRTLRTLTDGKDPITVFASTSHMNFQYGQIQTDRWQLSDEQQADPAVRSRIMELAGGIKYRRSLRSLFRPDHFEGNHRRLDSNTDLILIFEDDTHISLTHLGTAAGFSGDGKGGFILATVVNEEALAALSDYIMAIGEKE